MEITPTFLILVGVVCVVLGFLASVLLNTLAVENESPDEGGEEAPPGGRKGRYTPVFRVWREKGAGTLVVEMDGKAMITPDPLTEIQRERLERSVRDLRAWLGMGLAGTQAAQTEKPTPAEPQEFDLSRIGVPPPTNQTPKQAAPAAMPAEPTARSSAISYPQPPLRSTAAQPPAPKGKDEPVIKPSDKSIVMQIEDILQDMIAGTPLEQRGVHLIEDPARGVIVQIGIDHYEGIDSVPDAHIKGIIQSAVKEWEQSQ